MKICQLKEVAASSVKTKLQYHDELTSDLWDAMKLKDDVKECLNGVVNAFKRDIDLEMDIKDIVVMGSACNYNYSSVSDVDLHVIVTNKEDDIEYKYLSAACLAWKDDHKITVRGFPVELYIQSGDEVVTENAAIYSLTDNKWLRKPEKENPPPNIDDPLIKEKAAKIMTDIDNAIKNKKVTADTLIKIKDNLKSLRKSGLKKGGEFHINNLIYKTVRNNGYIEKLFNHIYKLEDEELSL